jgi:acyl carrier protein phosphodiesterase
MNYLAHLFLSFNDEQIAIGNFMADFVKGNKFNDYPSDIRRGILIHREIDHYTDHHEILLKGKKRLFEDYRHYSGVIMDIYYDHFLAKNWSEYSDENLDVFCERQYLLLNNNIETLPDRCQYLLKYMESGNWLLNYQYIHGIQFALSGLSKRTSFESGMQKAVKNLEDDYQLYEGEFQAFFKDILNHIHNFTDQLA